MASYSEGAKLRPQPGDLFICYECGLVGIYRDDLSIRKMTTEEFQRFSPEEWAHIWRASLRCRQHAVSPTRLRERLRP